MEKNELQDKLITGKLGNSYTKRFLKSKYVKIVSEGDFLTRIRSLCFLTYIIPFQVIWLSFFIYIRVVIGLQYQTNIVVPDENIWLVSEQIFILNLFISIQAYHIFILFMVMIIMLNMTMSRGVTIFSVFFNVLYISEILFYASLIFFLEWINLLQQFSSLSTFWEVFNTQWIWIVVLLGTIISFSPLTKIFKEINIWNREYISIDRYRKTEDKENSFIFKTWVTPGEITARKTMITAGLFAIMIASIFQLLDVFSSSEFLAIKYVILIFGHFVFLVAFVLPYNKYSLIFYWLNQAFLLGLMIYGLVVIQNMAWHPNNWYMYLYLLLIIPWILSLKSAINYSWTIKKREGIKAVVLNTFLNNKEFEQYLQDQKNNSNIKESETDI